VAAKIPTDFSTLLNEWNPIDLKEVYADGAGVASWVDSKASANLAQATGADQPLFRAAVTNFGGLPGVDAVSGDFVSGTITNDNQATTWMMVIDDDQSSGNAQILQCSQQIGYFGGNLAAWAGGSNLVSTYARAAGALFICVVFNGASSVLYWRRIDAGAGAPSSVTGNCGTNGTGTTLRLGNHSAGSWPAFDGRYGPVAIFNAALTSTDVQDLFDGVLARINGGPETDHNILLSTDAADAAVTVGSGTKKKAYLHAPGGSSTQVVKVSAAGPTAPLQMTDGAGTTDGAAIAWYTDPLTAQTIAGAISWAMWTQENATANNVAVAVKIERCSGDGTVFSTIVDPATSQAAGEAPTTAASDSGSASAANVTDTTLTVGDRLRITIWIDDAAGQGGTGNMGSGGWGKAWYGARSGQGLASLTLAEALAVLSVFTATAAQTLPALTQTGAGTNTPPTFTGAATQTLPSVGQAAAGTVSEPGAVTGDASSVLPAAGQSAAGTFDPPTFTAEAASSLPAVVQAAAGTRTAPAFSGSANQALPAFIQAAGGTRTNPVFAGSSSQVLPALGQGAAGTASAPGSGSAAQQLPAVTHAATGTTSAPVVTGTAGSQLRALTQAAAGTTTAPVFTAAAAHLLTPPTSSAAGLVTPPTFIAAGAQTLPAAGQTAAGTATAPAFTGAIVAILAPVTQAATGTVTLPALTPLRLRVGARRTDRPVAGAEPPLEVEGRTAELVHAGQRPITEASGRTADTSIAGREDAT
jgi:hypothetical protein